MPRTTRKPLTEQDFVQNPTGKQFLNYALNSIGSMISRVEMKWNPGQSGMSLDLFVNDAALYAIELAREDHAKGLFRNENADSFRKFFYGRILKAFHTKLEDLADDPGRASSTSGSGSITKGRLLSLRHGMTMTSRPFWRTRTRKPLQTPLPKGLQRKPTTVSSSITTVPRRPRP